MFRNLPKVSTRSKPQTDSLHAPLAISLEARMMFDGAVAATVAETTASQPTDTPDAASSPDASHDTLAAASESATADQRQDLVFIDGKVADKEQLIASLRPGVEVVVLDGNRDGLQQIADYLQGRQDIDAIHIFSHGEQGLLKLGSATLDNQNVASRSTELAAIGASLSSDGDILLYGCDIGRSDSGAALVEQLATLTQADIAASSDRTGAAAMGGDWELERQSGEIAAHDVLDMAQLANYDNLLALPSATQSFGDTYWNNNTGGNTVDGFNITESTGATRASSPDSIYFNTSPQMDGDGNYYYELTWTADNVDLGTFDLDGMVIQSFGGEYRLDFSATSGGIAVDDSFTYSGAQGPLTIDLNASKYNDISSFTLRVTNLVGASSVANMDLQQLILADLKGANSAPTIGNLNGDSVAWNGAGNTVHLDLGSNASLTDTELGALNGGNGNWSGASLVIQRNGTAVASDILGFDTDGALFTVSNGNLQANGQTFATFTNSNGVLTVNFTSSGTNATTALVNDVAQRITYRNDTPAGDATIRFTLNDGAGGSASATTTVTSDTIYVTNNTDTATINVSNGVSFSEAVAIAAADNTGSQTIVFDSSLAGQTLNLNAVSINESLTFDLDQVSGLTLTGGTITLGGGTTQTFSNGSGDTASIIRVVAGSGALTKAGAGNLTLSGAANSFSGATNIAAGTLTVANGNAIADNSSVSIAAGATLALNSNETIGNLSGAGAINLGSSTLTTTQTADTTFSGNISGNGGLSISQTGSASHALTLSGSNSYSGSTTLLNYGWLKLDGDASVSSNSAVRVNGNSVLTLLSDQTIGSLASNNANASIQLGSHTLTSGGDNTSTSVSGIISGSGSLIKQGNGVLTLAGSNSYSGTTTVSAGTLSIAGDGNLGTGGLTLAGSTLAITGATTIDNAIALTGNSTIDNSNAVTISGAISGAYDLTKTGVGTLTLSANNSYGATFVNAGTLSVSSDGNLGSGTVNLAAGTTLALTGAATIDNAIVLGGNATVTAAANATLSGVVSGAYTLTKAGASTLTLSGTNTYGATTVSAGTLSVASDANLGNGTLTLAAGSTLATSNATTIDNAIALSGNATVNTGADTTLSGVISGGNNLTKTGAATLTLSGSNSYNGSTNVNAGTLSVAGDGNLGAGSLNLANGTTLLITGNTTIDNALALTGVATINAGAAATLSGVISGSGGLTKTGSGSLSLSASNTNTGSTTVSAGTLLVDGSTSSATTVANGATLAGGGTLGGDVTVQNGGTLSPGNGGAGTLTVNGNLTLDAGSTLALDINGTSAGTGYDQIVVNGNVDVSGATLSVTHGYAAGNGEIYEVILNDAADAIVGTFSGLSEGGTFNAAGNGTQLTTSYAGGTGTNDLTLTAPTAPTVTSVSSSTANGTYKIGDTIVVTVQFSSTVNVTGTPTLTLETGTTDRVLNYLSGSGSDTLSFSYTIQAGDSSADLDYASTSALSLNGGSIQDGTSQAALLTLPTPGAAGSLGANKALVVDGVRPAASSITLSDTALRIGETATVTVTFNEAVQGLDIADFSVANGSLSGLSSSDGGLTWTATFTPSSNITDASNIITLDNSGVMDLAGNIGSGSTDSANYAIDTQRPTASILVADSALKAGQSTTVTITFSEAVTGLTTGDFSVANGTLSNLSTSDNITYTATLTPSANVTDSSNLITLDNTGITDLAGNTGTGSTDSGNYAIDTQRPTATIVVADTALKAGQSTTVTVTFSEAVTGLTTGDFSVANGALSNLSSSDGGITWTATLTPNANVTDTTNLITLDNTGYTDAGGNTGTGTTDSNNYAVDSQRPTANIVVNDTALAIGETSVVTITFNEAVTGLSLTDFSVANGALSNLSTSDNITYTATLTPSSSVTDTSNMITLDNTGVQDAAGNIGTGSTNSNNYAIDTQRPTATIVVSDTALKAGQTTSVTITFSEAVTGLTITDFSVANGSLSGLSSNDGGITWTATLTPNANVTDTTNLITLDNTGITDLAGNTGTGSTDSGNYAIDTQRPTATIVVADTALKAGQSTTVTVTFSEAVTGLSTDDFSVANGGLRGLSSSDGGITWTATLTPNASVTDASNLITLNNTGYTDTAGNTGTGTTASNNYAIDTQRPTATIVVNDTALAIGETTAVTITFNEAVTGLSLADFSVANGALSNLSTSDNITYTAILTPNGNIADGSNVITLDNTGVQDAAGNIGSASTNSNNYAIDTQRPSATIQLSDTALAAGESATVTITFNEAVTGLSLADLSATNGTLSGLSSNDGGITWTATLTPDANVTASSNLITLNNTAVQDAAGNAGIGGTLSSNYAVDTVVPLIGSVNVPAGVQYNAGDTLTFVVNASEAVLVNGTPRLALDIGGTTIFADYVAGSGTTTLVFQYNVQPGLNDADGITVTGLQNNGGSLRDATGNAMNLTLNNVGDTSGVRIDTTVPTATLTLDQASSSAGNVRYTLTFSEDVSGVDLSDFSLVSTGSAQGNLSSLVQIDARTYQISISNVVGSGSLALSLNSSGTGISDSAGNTLTGGLVGQPYTQNQTEGDPEFRSNPGDNILPTEPGSQPDTALPPAPAPIIASPLLPPPLFDLPTLGSGIPTLGNIFINNGALAPSYIAQVFSSSDSGSGSGSAVGFLGFGGGDASVFGSSSFSGLFSKEVPQQSGDIQLRWGGSLGGNDLGAVTGAPTLGQQLQEIGASEQRQIRDLAWALGQLSAQMPQA
ncbi:Ig-like domain-containing protein [Pseudomonas sp. AA-38]|uniref:Ig-like domain-containing protein n=1 Tax=Pseudomonas sp. AA-38 TaxID=3028807 RepID=UPI0023F74676|nr:Ig-like domain-containing protein [Pseudomonas sp. AA-38]